MAVANVGKVHLMSLPEFPYFTSFRLHPCFPGWAKTKQRFSLNSREASSISPPCPQPAQPCRRMGKVFCCRQEEWARW